MADRDCRLGTRSSATRERELRTRAATRPSGTRGAAGGTSDLLERKAGHRFAHFRSATATTLGGTESEHNGFYKTG